MRVAVATVFARVISGQLFLYAAYVLSKNAPASTASAAAVAAAAAAAAAAVFSKFHAGESSFRPARCSRPHIRFSDGNEKKGRGKGGGGGRRKKEKDSRKLASPDRFARAPSR